MEVRLIHGREEEILIFAKIVNMKDTKVYTINLKNSQLTKGIYFIIADTHPISFTKKIIIE